MSRRFYVHALRTHFPSKGCKQRLSTEELELLTQNSRMDRHAKKAGKR